VSERATIDGVVSIGPGGERSKAEHAYTEIRRSIVDGRQGPGSRLVIEQIARSLDISVVPVREAIRRLEAEGYVTYVRNVGATVASIDTGRYAETVETLAIIEAAATGLALPHLTRADLRDAHRINNTMRRSVKKLDPVEFTARNHEFHEVLYCRCPNRHLLDMVVDQWRLVGSIRRSGFSYAPERAAGSVDEHDRLLELIETDAAPDVVEAYAREHRMRTVRRVLEALAEQRRSGAERVSG
jgi:DNA-binding GntR family transcriptional regulator